MNKLSLFLTLALLSSLSWAQAASKVKASFFKVDITLEEGNPLGGYLQRIKPRIRPRTPRAIFYPPSQGVLDRNYARGLILEKEGERFLFLSLDAVAVDSYLKDQIFESISSLGFKAHHLFISASHTHSGPGTLARNPFWELLAMDKYNKKNFKLTLEKISSEVIEASSRLEEGFLEFAQFKTRGLQENRRSGQAYNGLAKILHVKNSSQEILGGIINYSIHGTALDPKNLYFSSDVPGAISSAIEDHYLQNLNETVFLFTQGAVGDIAPSMSGESALAHLGEAFLETYLEKKNSFTQLKSSSWKARSQEIHLGNPRFNIKKCLTISSAAPTTKSRFFLPKSSLVTSLKLGSLFFLTLPGELTSLNGDHLSEEIRKFNHIPILLGLTNNYLGYFTSEDEFDVGGYEACASFYGPLGTQNLIDGYKALIEEEL